MKRATVLLFPGGFEQLILRCLAARSQFIRHQLELLGEDGLLELPAELGSLWLEALLSTYAGLLATADGRLVQYFKAAEFFQDNDLIKTLCTVLGSRVFKANGDACPAEQSCSHGGDPAEVLGELSNDQAIEVLRSAPGSCEEQLIQLPCSARPLAPLAHLTGLGAVCYSVSESPGASSELPLLAICVDTTQAQADMGIMPDTATSSDIDAHASCAAECSGASMWPLAAELNVENVDNGLYSLEQRGGSIACCLVARSRTLQNHTIQLPDTARVVFVSSSGEVNLKNVTFQGGAVVCMGTGCKATFDDVVFEKCSLVVLAGAQVTLRSPHFRDMDSSQARISIYAHGAGTKVAVKGGTITGGTQGVTVQAGACFEASDLTVTGVGVSGVEVKHEGSSLELSGCKLHDFPSYSENVPTVTAVRVHARSSAQLSSLSIAGMAFGVHVFSHASVTLCECTVSDTVHSCVSDTVHSCVSDTVHSCVSDTVHSCVSDTVHACVSDTVHSCVLFSGAATGTLDQCTLSGSMNKNGLVVVEPGSCVCATRCHFLNCRQRGALATDGAALTADACTSSGNRISGYTVDDAGSVMELTNCNSTDDYIGCVVHTGKLTASKVVVSGSELVGFSVVDGGSAMLWECTAAKCGVHGVTACGEESSVELHGCTLQQNAKCGVFAQDDSVVDVRGCSSSGNEEVGYYALTRARMTVSSSSSDGDSRGCGVAAGGQLTMEGLTVDGVVQAYKMLCG